MRLIDRLSSLGLFQASIDHLRADPRSARVLDNPLQMPLIDIDKFLRTLPSHSLGYTFAKEMKRQGIDPNFFRHKRLGGDGENITNHTDQTHDLWHVVTGFDTSIPGELGLQGFLLAQLRTPQAYMFIGGGLLRCLFANPKDVGVQMDAIVDGWQLGKRWPPLFALDWNALWEMPLENIRHELDNGQIPHGSAPKVDTPQGFSKIVQCGSV